MTSRRQPADRAATPLDRERILQLLNLLDERLRARGVAADLYVVGGAAVAVTVADRRVTADVDVARLDLPVIEEAHALASSEGLPQNWLNCAAAAWVPPLDLALAEPATGLSVRYAPPEHLLAMKMVALRQQDAPDIAALVAHLGLVDAPAERFARLLRDVYRGDGVLQQVLGVTDDRTDAEVQAIGRRVAQFASQPPRAS